MHAYRVELDRITSRKTLHAELARVFSFPDYYGRNWDVSTSALTTWLYPRPSRWSTSMASAFGFRFRLPREAKLLARCLRAMAERCLRVTSRWMACHRAAAVGPNAANLLPPRT
jgi:RNAse (barnase) inhibitor barstar